MYSTVNVPKIENVSKIGTVFAMKYFSKTRFYSVFCISIYKIFPISYNVPLRFVLLLRIGITMLGGSIVKMETQNSRQLYISRADTFKYDSHKFQFAIRFRYRLSGRETNLFPLQTARTARPASVSLVFWSGVGMRWQN